MSATTTLFSKGKEKNHSEALDISLYGDLASAFVRKVDIFIIEKKIPCTYIFYNPMLQRSKEFLAMNPLNKIPVLTRGNYSLADSSAICQYLDKTNPNPAFYPEDPEALGKVLQLEEYADTALFNVTAPPYFQTVLRPLYRKCLPDEQVILDCMNEKLPPVCDYLDEQLKGKTYLVNNQFTVADVAVASMFLNMFAAGFPLPTNKWPSLNQYLNSIFMRPSFQARIPVVNALVEKGKEALDELTQKNQSFKKYA